MKSIIVNKDGISFELDQIKLTAKIISSPQARDHIFITKSINYQSQDYLITRIDDCSFKDNQQIYTIEFSKDSELRSIGNEAFCFSSIEVIHIPSTVDMLDEGWCSNTKSLNRVYLSPNNKNYKYLDETQKIIIGKSHSKSGEFDTLVFSCRDVRRVTIPSTIRRIGSYAFNQSILKYIKFEKNSKLEIIEKGAFNNCQIQSIEIPANVYQLDEFWLGQRWNQMKISISSENKVFKYINDSMIVGKSDPKKNEFDVLVFATREIQEAVIPSSIKYINSYSFFNCNSLKKVEFQSDSNLISIGQFSFYYSSIEEITIPRSCQVIQKHAFENCKNLKSIIFHKDSQLTSIPSKFISETLIEKLTVSNNIEKFQPGWSNCTDYLFNVVISPDNKNFSYLDEDKKVIIGKSNPSNSIFDVIIFACRDIQKVCIPSTIKYIESYAFQYCKNLNKIEFDKNCQLKSIGKKAFQGSSIKCFDVPPSVTNLSPYCLSHCKSLKSINIPENSQLEKFKDYTFFYTPIKQIFFPPKLNEFKFLHNHKLINIKISKENQNFKYLDESNKIIIGKSDPKSDTFDVILFALRDIQKVFIPSFIKYIGDEAFAFCKNLQEVTFEENSKLISIEKDAFSQTNIKQIKIPSHVKYIGKSCFSSCQSLQKVEFEKGSELTIFHDYLFDSSGIEFLSFPSSLIELKDEWCSCTQNLNFIQLPPENENFVYLDSDRKLIGRKSSKSSENFDVIVFASRDVNEVFIPLFITQISQYAFADCCKICKVFIPKKVELIDDFAFYNCNNLRSIEFENGSMMNSVGYHSFGFSLIRNFVIPNNFVKFDLNAFLNVNELLSIEFLSVDITLENFLCANKITVVSFPNAKKICIEDDFLWVLSESFTLFTPPNLKFDY